MQTITRKQTYPVPAGVLFDKFDSLDLMASHMTSESGMLMGSKLAFDYLSKNKHGPGTSYRWYGKVLGLEMDFSVKVVEWEQAVSKVWETLPGAKMIIFNYYRMELKLTTGEAETVAFLSISYEKPVHWFWRPISFLLAGWYCRWCLKKMMTDVEKQLNIKERQNFVTP